MKKKLFFLVLFFPLFLLGCGNQEEAPIKNDSGKESQTEAINNGVKNNSGNNVAAPEGNDLNNNKANSSATTTDTKATTTNGSTANKAELDKMQKQLEASVNSLGSLDENQTLE